MSTITEMARRARADIGVRAREAQLAMRSGYASAQRTLTREHGTALSEIERQEQAALRSLRAERSALERKGDIPGAPPIAKQVKVEAQTREAEIARAAREAQAKVEEESQEIRKEIEEWHTGEAAKIQTAVAEAESAVASWQREQQALQAVAPARTPTIVTTAPQPEELPTKIQGWKHVTGSLYIMEGLSPEMEAAVLQNIQEEAQKAGIPKTTEGEPDYSQSPEWLERLARYEAARGSPQDIAELRAWQAERQKEALSKLEPYKQPDGTYDVYAAIKSGDPDAMKATISTFRPVQLQPVWNYINYEKLPEMPYGDWAKLSTSEKEKYRPVYSVTLKQYVDILRTGTDEDLKKLYIIEPTPIDAGTYAKLDEAVKQYYVPQLSMWESLTPWGEELGETATLSQVGLLAADVIVPGVYVGRHWGELQPWEKGVGIALDVATFIPFVNIASAGVRAGLTPVRALARATLAEVRAPITTLIHPIESAKSIIYPVETLLRPRRVPIAAVEIRESAVRIPVTAFSSPEEALRARDILTSLAMKGEGATIQLGDKAIQLTPTALQRVVSGAAVHTTPDIRPFLHGAIIQEGREGGLFLSPTLHTRFTFSSAFGELPKGNIPGAVIIRNPELLSRLRPSGKIYRRQVEIEKVLGTGTRLPPPSQVLYTRDVSGRKLALLIIGEKLGTREIAELKIMGTVDTVRDIFAPAYRVSKADIGMMDELVELGNKIKKLNVELAAARSSGQAAKVARLEDELARLNPHAFGLARRIDTRFAAVRPMRPIGLGRGVYITTGIYNEYARSDPEGFARFMKGLPRTEQARILGEITSDSLRSRLRESIKRVPRAGRPPRRYTGLAPARGLGRMPPGRVPPRLGEPARVARPAIVSKPPRLTRVPRRPRAAELPVAPLLVKLPKTEADKKKAGMPMGSFCWRQGRLRNVGDIWWTIKPPYRGMKDMEMSTTPPPGVKVVEGPRSAYKTITKLGARVPKEVLIDLGIMDIHIKKHGGTMRYRRDVKQKTSLGYPVGMPSGVGRLRER